MCYKQVYKISSQYLHFLLCNGQKPGEGDDITFLNRIFGIFLLSHVKTNELFGILRHNWTR